MSRPVDHHARALALDPSKSFAVTAPAGSGKTGLLTQRVLTLLSHCDEPEEVLAITFTRKAAAEMHERISQALVTASTTARPQEAHEQLTWDLAHAVLKRDQELNWQLLKSPARLRIQTIDGLCRSITQFQPLTSGLGGSTKMLDDPSSAYEQAVNQVLKQLEQPEGISNDLAVLLEHLDNNLATTQALLMSLLSRRDQWMTSLLSARDAKQYLESVLHELNEEVLSELASLLSDFSSDLCLAADFAADNCLRDKPDSPICELKGISQLPDTNHSQLAKWRSITDLLLTAEGNWRKSGGVNKNIGFPTSKDKEEKARLTGRKQDFIALLGELQEQPKLISLLAMVRYLPPVSYPDKQWTLLDGLTRILPSLVGELNWVFRQLNATDFIEVTQGALLALGADDTPTETTLMLDYQIRHILVDEFQDTSTPQLLLLEKLTAGWEINDGRTLFIVGDGMQSCYGFRAANVGIFLDARDHGIGNIKLEPLELTVNFRSQEGIVEWVNDTFEQAFPDSDDVGRGAVRYSHSESFRPSLEGQAVRYHGFSDAPCRKAEAEKVVDIIKQLQVTQPNDSIALLVRNRGYLTEILPELQKHKIDWHATDIEPLSGRIAVMDLLTITRALLNPGDRNAWLALFRTPYIGLSNADLLALAGLQESDKQAGFKTLMPLTMKRLSDSNYSQVSDSPLSDQGLTALRRVIPLIHHSWMERRRKSLRHQVEGLWLSIGGPATLEVESDLSNVEDFFNLLDRFDEGGSLNEWDEFSRAVSKLYARPSSESANPVQVMTIHKSKGLEFDHVIIPGLDKSSKADEHQLLLWQERINARHEKQLILSPLAAKGDDQDRLYNFLREENKIKQRLESTRLLYVGCTRAIKQLHLMANLNSNSKGGLKPPSSGSLLSPLWVSVSEGFSNQCINLSEASEESASDADRYDYFLRRLPRSWERPQLSPDTVLQAYRGQEYDDDDNTPPEYSVISRDARHLGTVLHRTLNQMVDDGISVWDQSRINRQEPSWATQLQTLGVSVGAIDGAVELLQRAVLNVLDDPIGQWLLNNEHSDSACELELWSAGQTPKLSIVDRTFVDDDVRWIIDYKSSEPNAGVALKDFVTQEVEAYRNQLSRYSKLFTTGNKTQDPNKIRTALYFPLIKHLEIVEI